MVVGCHMVPLSALAYERGNGSEEGNLDGSRDSVCDLAEGGRLLTSVQSMPLSPFDQANIRR